MPIEPVPIRNTNKTALKEYCTDPWVGRERERGDGTDERVGVGQRIS